MSCKKCKSSNMVSVSGKTSDLCHVYYHDKDEESNGYVPDNIGIGGGDYIEFVYCLNCGTISGNFPISL